MVSLCGNIIHLKGIVLFKNLKHNSKKYTRRYYYKIHKRRMTLTLAFHQFADIQIEEFTACADKFNPLDSTVVQFKTKL